MQTGRLGPLLARQQGRRPWTGASVRV